MQTRSFIMVLAALTIAAGSAGAQAQTGEPRPSAAVGMDSTDGMQLQSRFEQNDARSIALQERMKADFERLRTAQERYWSEMRFYADTLSMLEQFRPRSGATFRLHDVTVGEWSVEITHASLPGSYIRARVLRPTP